MHAASGRTALATLDLAKVLRGREIVTSANFAKLETLWDYGTGHLINLNDGFANEVKALSNGQGADIIYEPVGEDVFDEWTRYINFGG